MTMFKYRPGRSKQQAGTGGQNKEDIASTAYLRFKRHEQVAQFANAFDGHVFRDKQGRQSAVRVEYAPFQRIPAKRQKPDPFAGTIEQDPHYLAFLATLNEPAVKPADMAPMPKAAANKQQAQNTPLLQALRAQKQQAAAAKTEAAKASKKAAAEAAATAKKAATSSVSSDKAKSATTSPAISPATIGGVQQPIAKSDTVAAGGKKVKKAKGLAKGKTAETAAQSSATKAQPKNKMAAATGASSKKTANKLGPTDVVTTLPGTSSPTRADTTTDIDQSSNKSEAATTTREAPSDSVTSSTPPKSPPTALASQRKANFDPFALALNSYTQKMANKVKSPVKTPVTPEPIVKPSVPSIQKLEVPTPNAPKPLPAIPSFVGGSRGRAVSAASRGRGRSNDVHPPMPNPGVEGEELQPHETSASHSRGRGMPRGRGRCRGKLPD